MIIMKNLMTILGLWLNKIKEVLYMKINYKNMKIQYKPIIWMWIDLTKNLQPKAKD